MSQFNYGMILISAVAIGCSDSGPQQGMPQMPPPAVTVAKPTEREVTDYADFTGRTMAVEAVKVRARVWGHLQKINFAEGAEVKKGDLLFVLDQRPYKATLARVEAEAAQTQARVTRLEGDLNRARNLLNTRSISREEFDKISGDLIEAQAALRSSLAGLEMAKLNFEYTEVRAPVDGQTSRAMVTVGNLVESGEMGGTLLTHIVSINPMYVYFDVDDLTFLRIKPMVRDAMSHSSPGNLPPVLLAIGKETGFPHQGVIDFIDNQVDANTGTVRMRGVFENDDRSLTPGLFGRVRVQLGRSHKALLVTDRAIESDQGQKVVYVVGDKDVAEKRIVKLGRLHDGLREIESGVKPGERIVVDGLQRVRPGAPVAPNETK